MFACDLAECAGLMFLRTGYIRRFLSGYGRDAVAQIRGGRFHAKTGCIRFYHGHFLTPAMRWRPAANASLLQFYVSRSFDRIATIARSTAESLAPVARISPGWRDAADRDPSERLSSRRDAGYLSAMRPNVTIFFGAGRVCSAAGTSFTFCLSPYVISPEDCTGFTTIQDSIQTLALSVHALC